MKYRPEIDGLRTLAIVPVVLYHLKIQTGAGYVLPGGFLGVDVFFVISGYLITSILLREQAETGTVSILRFYQRRARRILPALFLVIFATLIAGWFMLLSSELIRLAWSIVAAVAFVSNGYWFFELGEYGAQSGLLQPMLHTWSLAIEEQFYLVFPLLLLLLKPNLRAARALGWMVLLLVISLVLSQITTLYDPEFSFFSPVSRAWEMLFGSALALVAFRWPDRLQMGPRLGWVVPKLAVLVLLASMVLIALPEVNHPGLITLPTVLATAALICCSDRTETTTAWLASAPMVYIGKLSYSIYLWHFPVFAFGRLSTVGAPDALSMTLWVAVTLVLAVAGYYLVERPCRFKLPGRQFYGAMGACVAACAAAVVFLTTTDLDGRGRMGNLAEIYGNNEIDNAVLRDRSWEWLNALASESEIDITANAKGPSNDERTRLWFTGDDRTKLLIIGNSHSKDLFNALYTTQGVQAHFDVARFGIAKEFPADQLAQLYAAPNFAAADWIVISTRYSLDFEERLPPVLKALRNQGKQVVLVGNTAEFSWPGTLPVFDWFLRAYGAAADMEELGRIGWNARATQIIERNGVLRRIAAEAGVPYLSREDLVCDSATKSCAMATDDGMKTMYDYGHWTLEGAAFFGQRAADQDWLAPLTLRDVNE